jgi:hypothetical protein
VTKSVLGVRVIGYATESARDAIAATQRLQCGLDLLLGDHRLYRDLHPRQYLGERFFQPDHSDRSEQWRPIHLLRDRDARPRRQRELEQLQRHHSGVPGQRVHPLAVLPAAVSTPLRGFSRLLRMRCSRGPSPSRPPEADSPPHRAHVQQLLAKLPPFATCEQEATRRKVRAGPYHRVFPKRFLELRRSEGEAS